MRKTCPKTEYLEIDGNIRLLAEELLSENEILESENISQKLAVKSTRVGAIRDLKRKVGDTPKRPVYYANFELNGLPVRTRDAVRYIGDYIDQLVKCLAVDLFNDPSYGQKSLGINANKLRGKIPEDLQSQLMRYNNQIYTPAKHEFKLKEGRKHLFTSKEVVYIYYFSLKLKDRIIDISTTASDYSQDLY
jgi:hypothetical protein